MRCIHPLVLTLLVAVHAAAAEAAPVVDVPESARAPATVVDAFSAALAAGDLAAAGALLDPGAVILESGEAEHTAAEYLGGHAKADAAFLKGARQVLERRTGRANGDLAWIASESELHVQRDGKPATIVSTETMVLHRGANAWKIVHIHWSSRIVKPGDAH